MSMISELINKLDTIKKIGIVNHNKDTQTIAEAIEIIKGLSDKVREESGIQLIQDKETGLWKEFKPFATVVYETEEEFERMKEILRFYKEHKDKDWIPLDDERKPKNESYVLVSFSNCDLADIARYEEDEEGGIFYPGDEEKSYKEFDLFVNAWQPLPESYRPEQEDAVDQEQPAEPNRPKQMTQEEREKLWEEK